MIMLSSRLLSFSLLGLIIVSEAKSPVENDICIPIEHYSSKLVKDKDTLDAHRLKVIDQTLTSTYQDPSNESKQIVPLEIVGMIEGYDYDEPMREIYNNVMDQLSVPMEKRKMLDFYDKNFIIYLFVLVLFQRDALKGAIFLINLSKLLFKWIINMGQVLDDTTFRKASKGVRLFGFLISGKKVPKDLYALPENEHPEEIISIIWKYEFMEYSHIFSLFASAIESFYLNEMTCQDIEQEYFQGRFNSNILLKFMILIYDPLGEMKKCIVKGSNLPDQTRPEIKNIITPGYLANLKLRGPEELVCNDVMAISRFSLEFILNSNRKIIINNPSSFFVLMKKLIDIGLPTKKPLSEFVEFVSPVNVPPIKWDRAYFKNILEGSKENLTDREYSQYEELIDQLL